MTDSTTEILDGFRQLVHGLRQFSHATEARHGISGAQLFILGHLRDEDGASMGRLAELTRTHPSSVTGAVAKLEARKLVSRRPSRADARQTEVRLTAAGKRVLASLERTPQDRLLHALQALPPDERARFAVTLATVLQGAGFAALPPSLFFEDVPPPLPQE